MLQAYECNKPGEPHDALAPLRVWYRLDELYKRFQGSVGRWNGDSQQILNLAESDDESGTRGEA